MLQGAKGLAQFGFIKYEFIFIYFTITGVKKIVHCMEDFVYRGLLYRRSPVMFHLTNVQLHNKMKLIFASNLSMVDPLIFLSPQKMK